MKPIQLRMSAFGSFVDEVTVDFTLFGDHGLFLIAGQTGSGKTTIFDGIVFALFGKASGSNRDNSDFRSGFAKNHQESYVELTFKINGQIYVIKRTPRYFRDGYKTENKTTALLTMPNGQIIDGVTEVDQKIDSIIGLNESQFRQIIMFAQGESTKLLLSNSSEKETVFRNIFHTDNYAKIGDILAERNRQVSLSVSNKQATIDEILGGLQTDENGPLYPYIKTKNKDTTQITLLAESELNIDEASLRHVETLSLKKSDEILQLDRIIQSSNTINNDFKLLDAHKYKLEELLKKTDEIYQLQVKLDNNAKAKELNPVYQNNENNKRDLQNTHIAFTTENNLLIELTTKLVESKVKFDKRESNRELNTQRTLEIQNNLEILKKANDALSNQNKLNQATKLIDKLTSEKTTLVDEAKIKQADVIRIQKLQIELPSRKDDLHSAELNLTEQKSALAKYNQLLKNLDTYETLNNELSSEKNQWKNQENLCVLKEQEIATQESIHRSNQLGIFVSQLKDNEPCPICGSLDHPKPAHSNQQFFNVDLLDQLKEEFDELVEQRLLIQNNIIKKTTLISSIEKDWPNEFGILNIESLTSMKARLESQVVNLSFSIGDQSKKNDLLLAEIKNTENLCKTLQGFTSMLDENLSKQNKLSETIGTHTREVAILENKLKDNLFTYPGDCHSPSDLLALNVRLENQIKSSEDTYQTEKTAFDSLTSNQQKITGKVEQLKGSIEKYELDLTNSQKSFDEALKISNFSSEKDYLEKSLDRTIEKSYMKTIQEFTSSKSGLENSITDLKKRLEGKSVVEIGQYTLRKETINNELFQIKRQEAQLYSKIQNNKNRLNRFATESEEYLKLEKQHRLLETMSKLTNGQNSRKITLERYVLALYFDNILVAANYRLNRITNSRYKFERRTEKKGGSQQGLDLDIYDAETGKSRDVKTLSGGEAFKASLSLALGCSDVIQSYAGGVELNTLFIDEGFGMLDSASLDQALNILVDLNNDNKLIGIISHIQELKDRIPAKIIVTKGLNGSTIEQEF